jgi:hypothetical protein
MVENRAQTIDQSLISKIEFGGSHFYKKGYYLFIIPNELHFSVPVESEIGYLLRFNKMRVASINFIPLQKGIKTISSWALNETSTNLQYLSHTFTSNKTEIIEGSIKRKIEFSYLNYKDKENLEKGRVKKLLKLTDKSQIKNIQYIGDTNEKMCVFRLEHLYFEIPSNCFESIILKEKDILPDSLTFQYEENGLFLGSSIRFHKLDLVEYDI